MEDLIAQLKIRLEEYGERWKKNTGNKDYMRDCLAIIDAINALEDRIYGKVITDITYVL